MMLALVGCNDDEKDQAIKTEVKKKKLPPVEKEYGFVLNDFEVLEDWKDCGKPVGFSSTTSGTCKSSRCRAMNKKPKKVNDTKATTTSM